MGQAGGAGNKLSAWTEVDPSGKASAGNSELAARGWLATLGTFLLAGLGMAFTACMYPLLPIVSSLIAGQGATLSRGRGFLLSLLYVQGLALTYTAVGVVAGLTGSLLTVWLQQPAVVLSASALMVVFALSMFDLFSIQLPSALQSRLADTSNRLTGGKAATVFLMGALSALIIGPCVAPPLALALGYIGSTGDAVLGGAALYAMAMGLGLPLIAIGTFGGHVLPRAGHWMKAVKSAFGVVMLGLAIWLATPFLPPPLVMLLWAALLIGSAVFLGAFDSLSSATKASARLGKALGLLLFLLGGAQLVGLLSAPTTRAIR
ncbi:Thiol:disulfide interchange protein DsbD precursor [Chromobacterium violaceum]|uniref:Thiol:disulfide interchange protein DsbD n=1 Tax=Chromobacterium violaceum TaxID=536 RepID=A0A3S4HMH8_CHRVL|nr:Thiol:disulfide interchange protein DsbD precursor [Chromobacterium violaceum]